MENLKKSMKKGVQTLANSKLYYFMTDWKTRKQRGVHLPLAL